MSWDRGLEAMAVPACPLESARRNITRDSVRMFSMLMACERTLPPSLPGAERTRKPRLTHAVMLYGRRPVWERMAGKEKRDQSKKGQSGKSPAKRDDGDSSGAKVSRKDNQSESKKVMFVLMVSLWQTLHVRFVCCGWFHLYIFPKHVCIVMCVCDRQNALL